MNDNFLNLRLLNQVIRPMVNKLGTKTPVEGIQFCSIKGQLALFIWDMITNWLNKLTTIFLCIITIEFYSQTWYKSILDENGKQVPLSKGKAVVN